METRILLLLVLFACGLPAEGCIRSCSFHIVQIRCRVGRSADNEDNEIQITGSKKKEAHFSIALRGDPCSFNSYDADRDGTITKEELLALFCENERTEDLYSELDIITEDGVIKPDEFYSKAPLIIAECSNSDKTSDLKVE
ncbi:uncharacterized protein LOC123543893 [Mercenaria mercenaria]|uniref:uncharacterized protein LOC123543893 n=1 Tax=Mercenaria mercenaria TaxID=6596 RepID=UPI00234ED20F|nr:uncharacterized protein LOC123543893 [Mercenaria mercenaria]